jgi:hypothetical protein
MANVRALLRREFPDADPICLFEAGIPVYAVRLDIEVLVQRPLSSFEEFILQAIRLGVSARERIAALLGVEERDLITPGARLLQRGFIEQSLQGTDGGRILILTEQGRAALSEQGPPPVPQRKPCRLHFNAVTWMPIPLEDQTWTVEQMQKEGLVLLPMKRPDRLTLGDFTEQGVVAALKNSGAFQDSDITALLELKKTEKQYIAPVTVVLLKQRQSEEQQLVIYRNGYQLRGDSIALQHLFASGTFTLPTEVASFTATPLEFPATLAPAVRDTTQQLFAMEQSIVELETKLAVEHDAPSSEPQEDDRYAQRLQHLKEELRIKREE